MQLPGTILIVDDHVALAENLAEILADAGWKTAVAESADSALDRLKRGDVAALITDFRLPGRSGVELIAEMRRAGCSIPALVMSAYSDAATRNAAANAGAIDVLIKPLDVPHLIEIVRELGSPS